MQTLGKRLHLELSPPFSQYGDHSCSYSCSCWCSAFCRPIEQDSEQESEQDDVLPTIGPETEGICKRFYEIELPRLCLIGISLGEAQDNSPRRQPWDKGDG